MAPALTSISAVAVWPPSAAEMRAVLPSCGHAQEKKQHQWREGERAYGTVSSRLENRHTLQARCRFRGDSSPLPVDARDFRGARILVLKSPIPPMLALDQTTTRGHSGQISQNVHHKQRYVRPLATEAPMGGSLFAGLNLRSEMCAHDVMCAHEVGRRGKGARHDSSNGTITAGVHTRYIFLEQERM